MGNVASNRFLSNMEPSNNNVVFILALLGGIIAFSKEICEVIFGKAWPKSSKVVIGTVGILVFSIAAYLNKDFADKEAQKAVISDSTAHAQRIRADSLQNIHDSITRTIDQKTSFAQELLIDNKKLSEINRNISSKVYRTITKDGTYPVLYARILPNNGVIFTLSRTGDYPMTDVEVAFREESVTRLRSDNILKAPYNNADERDAFLDSLTRSLHVHLKYPNLADEFTPYFLIDDLVPKYPEGTMFYGCIPPKQYAEHIYKFFVQWNETAYTWTVSLSYLNGKLIEKSKILTSEPFQRPR